MGPARRPVSAAFLAQRVLVLLLPRALALFVRLPHRFAAGLTGYPCRSAPCMTSWRVQRAPRLTKVRTNLPAANLGARAQSVEARAGQSRFLVRKALKL